MINFCKCEKKENGNARKKKRKLLNRKCKRTFNKYVNLKCMQRNKSFLKWLIQNRCVIHSYDIALDWTNFLWIIFFYISTYITIKHLWRQSINDLQSAPKQALTCTNWRSKNRSSHWYIIWCTLEKLRDYACSCQLKSCQNIFSLPGKSV